MNDWVSIREPSLLDAIIPVVTLVGLIGLTIWLFGTDASFTGFRIERVSPPDQASPPVADSLPQPIAGGS